MASHPALLSWPSLSTFRRSHRAYYYTILAILLLFILRSISTHRQEDHWLYPSFNSSPDVEHSRLPVIRPGDITASSPREVRPQDDTAPVAREPIRLGTLRDVREENFYRGGTLTLTHGDDDGPFIYDPYPDYNGDEWRKVSLGSFQACAGPRGRLLSRSSADDMVSVYPGIPDKFPPPLLGSYAATGLDAYVCTDRFSRLRTYGYDNYTNYPVSASKGPIQTNWNEVNWGSLQTQCLERNAGRYTESQTQPRPIKHSLPASPISRSPTMNVRRGRYKTPPPVPQHKQRSAVILRAWHDMEWTDNLKQSVRSLVMELSLHSGAEYEVFILCHVKDASIPINTDDTEAMRNLKSRFVPREFQEITVLFNDKMLESWYPDVNEHSTVLQYWQPVQIFSQLFQDFDYYWQLEMDSKFTGHAYHFLEKSAEFAKRQARRYLWERNAYFYIPGTHGTWRDFTRMVGSTLKGRESVWGPKGIPPQLTPMTPVGPKPPVKSPEEDKYEWGVGEEADLITFLPMFDPTDTQWTFVSTLWGLSGDVPRRASPVAIGRVSKKLVQQMHEINQRGIGLASEMTAPSLALWHGLKAVHVPHPIYVDGKWSSKELGRILNPGQPEKINGGDDSAWNWNHQWDHILYRFSYMFTTQTAEDLYRRWLGYKIDPNQFADGSYHLDSQGLNWFESGDLREDLYGPLCFPSMLLHTVKNTEEKKGSGMAVPV
ncbi:hypothetical protein AAEP93_007712 [Penicillium crustosum]